MEHCIGARTRTSAWAGQEDSRAWPHCIGDLDSGHGGTYDVPIGGQFVWDIGKNLAKPIGAGVMRAHYDFDKMKARKNPYIRLLKQSVTIRLDRDIISYFKQLAERTGLPYQHLINLYLRDCAMKRKEPSLRWSAGARRRSH